METNKEQTNINESYQTLIDNRLYFEFNFTEMNYEIEKKRLNTFLENKEQENVSITCIKSFPPCLTMSNHELKKSNKELKISSKSIIINNNLFFGNEYVKINKKLSGSPFIVSSCKSCEHFKSSRCRGIFNSKFEDVKQAIIKKRNLKEYKLICLDYMNGYVGTSSECNLNCMFCGEKRKEYNPSCFISKKLSIAEIMHFINYLPTIGILSPMFGQSCLSGEPFLHKDINKILKIVHNFDLGNNLIITNGSLLSDEILDLCAKYDFELNLSLHSTDIVKRNKLMRCNTLPDPIKLIKKIISKGIRFHTNIVPLLSSIESGDLKHTILYLKKINQIPLVHKCAFDPNNVDPEILSQVDYGDDFLYHYLSSNNLIDDVLLESEWPKSIIAEFLPLLDNLLNKLDSTKKIFIPAPIDFSYIPIKNLIEKYHNVIVKPITAKTGLNVTISCTLCIEDFINLISQTKTDFDILILPRQSFNNFMNDLLGENINKLLSIPALINKEIILM